MDEYARADCRNPVLAPRSKRLPTTFCQIGTRRDKLLGMYRDRELNLRARVGAIFAPEEKKRQMRKGSARTSRRDRRKTTNRTDKRLVD